MEKIKRDERISTARKEYNKKQWYKDKMKKYGNKHNSFLGSYNSYESRRTKMEASLDLYNNKLNKADFIRLMKPYGEEVGELFDDIKHIDIISPKVKKVVDDERVRKFPYSVVAVNKEATTEREEKEYSLTKDYVVSEIMRPIQEQAALAVQQKYKGKELTPEEQEKVKQEVAQRTQAMTPEKVKKYVERDFQTSAEMMSQQLVNYLYKKLEIKKKFDKSFQDLTLYSTEVMYQGIFNGEPDVWEVNPRRFSFDTSPDNYYIEDGEYASCEYYMTPSQIMQYFGSELKDSEIDEIYDSYRNSSDNWEEEMFWGKDNKLENSGDSLKVLHVVWKSLREVIFVTYIDDYGEEQIKIVDGDYVSNETDINIEKEWLIEVYEGYRILEDIYLRLRPIPGQFKDIDEVHKAKLPYYGVILDNMVSLVERLKNFSYMYDVINHRLEQLIYSDRGKKVLMGIHNIPDKIGTEKWIKYFETSPYVFYDSKEEGKGLQDANSTAKVLDMSLASDIGKYIDMLNFIRTQAGIASGVPDEAEGQIQQRDAVANVQQTLHNSTAILGGLYEIHRQFKNNFLQGLIELAKVAYSQSKPRKLTYILDDLSKKIIDLDPYLLDNSTLGIFTGDIAKVDHIMKTVEGLSHAAMQNQAIELSDVIKVMRAESTIQMEESLMSAEARKQKQIEDLEQQKQQAIASEAEKAREFVREQHGFDLEEIVVKEEERRKTEIVKASLLAASFNPDQDKDKDGVNDFIELARNGLDAKIKEEKSQLDREKFEHDKEVDKKKLELENKKLKKQNSK